MVRLTDLFGVAMLFGIYSLFSAAIFVVLDAVDVAFTEASVGAGISTILMVGTLALTDTNEAAPFKISFPALFTVVVTGIALLIGIQDLPEFGLASAPVHTHVAPHYIGESGTEIGIPNIVTSVLASYRGYDTLGEVTVIFTAGVGVMILLGIGVGGSRKSKSDQDD